MEENKKIIGHYGSKGLISSLRYVNNLFNPVLIDTNNKIENNENCELCKECEGECCRNLGCFINPKDIPAYPNITKEVILDLLRTGYVSIDWYDDETEEYFLRMRNKKSPLIDPSWGGECIALTENGCAFKFENRPYGGRSLIPNKGDECLNEYDKEMAKEDWEPYREIIIDIIDNFDKYNIEYDERLDKIEPIFKRPFSLLDLLF